MSSHLRLSVTIEDQKQKSGGSFSVIPDAECLPYFTEAFRSVVSGVEAGDSMLEQLFPEMFSLFVKGESARKFIPVILCRLPPGTWRWPAFENFISDKRGGIEEPDFKAMAEMLASRVMKVAYSLHHKQQFLKTADHAPYMMFCSVDDDRTPDECKGLNGVISHYTSSFWSEHPIPCRRLDCRCSFIAMSERDLKKLSYKGI